LSRTTCVHFCLCSLCFTSSSFMTTAAPEVSTLSLHDALPILGPASGEAEVAGEVVEMPAHRRGRRRRVLGLDGRDHGVEVAEEQDRKSTRLNSSHVKISYAVFCLKKKKQ